MIAKGKFLIILVGLLLFLPLPAKAQNVGLPGGKSNHIYIKEGSNLKIAREDLLIRLHVGFAEVHENLQIKNMGPSQKVIFGFDQDANAINWDNLISNFTVTIDRLNIPVSKTTEVQNDLKTSTRIFEVNFEENQTLAFDINFWQINSADLRGTRGFLTSLKQNNFGKIDELNVNLIPMDGVKIDSFDKNTNPDLGLKLEPLGWQIKDGSFSWTWQNIEPVFDLAANFYWAAGDLAKEAVLGKNINLYDVSASFDIDSAWQMTDSSYLTFWPEKDGPIVGSEMEINFPNPRTIEEFRIIPGKANSLSDFKANNRPREMTLNFSDGRSQKFDIADSLEMQYLKFGEPVETKSVRISIDSVWPGAIQNNKTYVAEIEFGDKKIMKAVASAQSVNPKKGFFQNIGSKMIGFFKKIF